jgi:metallo-beta-lactamase family protein
MGAELADATAGGQHVATTVEPVRPDGAWPRDPEADLRAQPPHLDVDLDAPLYTTDDAELAITRFHATGYGQEFEVAPGLHVTFVDAGHILGSAIIQLRVVEHDGGEERHLVFSGDLGRPGTPILRDPTPLTEADYVLIESTYGGSRARAERGGAAHPCRDDPARRGREGRAAGALVRDRADAGGRLGARPHDRPGEIPLLPLYLDSPMASKASDIYRRHPDYYDEETAALLRSGDTPLDYPKQIVTNTPRESQAIEQAARPYMIVASNGMLTGGRVVGHLRNLIDDPTATILFVGYQGEGTLGAHLQAGAKEVKLDGQVRRVRCQIRSISGFSAHADESELLDWLRRFVDGKQPGASGYPRRVFLVHGDPEAQVALEPKVRALGLATHVPHWHERVTLD